MPGAIDRSSLPAVGPSPSFRFPSVERHVLPNGLRVRTVEHASLPVVSFVVSVEGGSGADPRGQEGLAALVADMLDEGTGALSAIDVSEAIARIGGDYDVEAGPDATRVSLMTLVRFADRGASLLADLITRPGLHAADVDRVRGLRIDRLRQLKDVAPALAERAFLRLVYGQHPYGHLSIGGEETLRGLTRDQVVAFHADRFRPTNATVIVAGGMKHASLLRLAADALGSWAATSDSTGGGPPASSIDPERAPRLLAVVPREGAAQSELRIGHLCARRGTPDYAALLVMNAVLGGQFVSRVNLKLREQKAYTYGARTGFDWKRGLSPFVLSTSVHTASTADAVADAVGEIEAIRGLRPVTDAELALAKASLTRGYPRGFETAEQVAHAVAQLALYDLPDTYFSDFVSVVNAVTAADVTRVAAHCLDPSRLTVLVVGDAAAVSASLPGLGFGEPQVLPVTM